VLALFPRPACGSVTAARNVRPKPQTHVRFPSKNLPDRRGTYQPEGMKAERRLLCAYEDRHAVVAALLGGGQLGDQPQISYPGQPALVATRVRVEPFEKRPDNQGAFSDLTPT